MSSLTICQHYKFGYCKFGDTCLLEHVKEICQESHCEIHLCSLRHPRRCKYFQAYNRHKFNNYCSYLHEYSASHLPSENDIIVLKSTVDQMNTIMNEHTNEVEDMKSKLVALEIENNNLINLKASKVT